MVTSQKWFSSLEKFVPVENTERLDTGLLSTLPRFINGCWRHHVLWLSYSILQRVKWYVLKMTHSQDCSTSYHSTHISGIFVWNTLSIFFTFTFICGMIFHFESQAHSVSIFKLNETFFLLTLSCVMFFFILCFPLNVDPIFLLNLSNTLTYLCRLPKFIWWMNH